MFDFGFWELALILVISLIVLGPERLPVFAAQLGSWIKKIKVFWAPYPCGCKPVISFFGQLGERLIGSLC